MFYANGNPFTSCFRYRITTVRFPTRPRRFGLDVLFAASIRRSVTVLTPFLSLFVWESPAVLAQSLSQSRFPQLNDTGVVTNLTVKADPVAA